VDSTPVVNLLTVAGACYALVLGVLMIGGLVTGAVLMNWLIDRAHKRRQS